MSGLDLVPLRDPLHIAAYHDLRRIELFERYGPFGVPYDPHVAQEDAPQNLPHVLLSDGRVVGTLRIDLINRDDAGFRLVTVASGLQSRGYGAFMMQRAEALVRAYGRGRIIINAARPAVPFYLRHGYVEVDWPDVLSFDPAQQMRLGKRLI